MQKKPLLFLLLGASQVNIVSSSPLPDIKPQFDPRHSIFSFVWKDYASTSNFHHVEKAFKLSLQELHSAIKDNNVPRIEWLLGPIINRCREGKERLIRLRFMSYVFVGA
jgi:hypothetical protein